MATRGRSSGRTGPQCRRQSTPACAPPPRDRRSVTWRWASSDRMASPGSPSAPRPIRPPMRGWSSPMWISPRANRPKRSCRQARPAPAPLSMPHRCPWCSATGLRRSFISIPPSSTPSAIRWTISPPGHTGGWRPIPIRTIASGSQPPSRTRRDRSAPPASRASPWRSPSVVRTAGSVTRSSGSRRWARPTAGCRSPPSTT